VIVPVKVKSTPDGQLNEVVLDGLTLAEALNGGGTGVGTGVGVGVGVAGGVVGAAVGACVGAGGAVDCCPTVAVGVGDGVALGDGLGLGVEFTTWNVWSSSSVELPARSVAMMETLCVPTVGMTRVGLKSTSFEYGVQPEPSRL